MHLFYFGVTLLDLTSSQTVQHYRELNALFRAGSGIDSSRHSSSAYHKTFCSRVLLLLLQKERVKRLNGERAVFTSSIIFICFSLCFLTTVEHMWLISVRFYRWSNVSVSSVSRQLRATQFSIRISSHKQWLPIDECKKLPQQLPPPPNLEWNPLYCWINVLWC